MTGGRRGDGGRWKEEWRSRKACPDGVSSPKRNSDAVREREERLGEEAGMMAATKKARQNTFEPVRTSPEHALGSTASTKRLTAILSLSSSALRGSRKTEWAKSLFRSPLELKVGTLDHYHFPDGMRRFARGTTRRPTSR